jgi:hypothetical protein
MYMGITDFKTNLTNLRDNYMFTDKEFHRLFGYGYDHLMTLTLEDDHFQESLQKSVVLTESFENIDQDFRLQHLIEVLHVSYGLSYDVLAKYSELTKSEIKGYLESGESLSVEQKFNACSRLTLLDRFISQMTSPEYIATED